MHKPLAAIILKIDVFFITTYTEANFVLNSRIEVLALKESLLHFGINSAYVEVETVPKVFELRHVKL